jgi:melanoma-associated antigen p97
MFDSYINHKDLIFQDATVRLLPIASENQTYTSYLGPDFIRRMQRMRSIDCVTGGASVIRLSSVPVLVSVVTLLAVIWTA